MKTKYFLTIIVAIFHITLYAQNEPYYYYKNQKVFLELDREYVSINTNSNTEFFDEYSSYYLSKTEFVESNLREYSIPSDSTALSKVNLKSYYLEIKTTPSVANNLVIYNNLINTLNQNSNVIKASPCFKIRGNKRLGLTNNFYVKLNSISDVGTLYDYAENYNLEIIGRDPYMQNWYIVSCSKNTPLNALEYANIFHESGLFQTAEPEFVYHDLQTSNNPFYNDQWGLLNSGQYGTQYSGIDINVADAWNITKGNGVKVAVYDHGFEMNHPDLSTNVYGNGV